MDKESAKLNRQIERIVSLETELQRVRLKLAQVRGALAFMAKLKKSDCEYAGEKKKQ
jgi:hypothetical protein